MSDGKIKARINEDIVVDLRIQKREILKVRFPKSFWRQFESLGTPGCSWFSQNPSYGPLVDLLFS